MYLLGDSESSQGDGEDGPLWMSIWLACAFGLM